MTPLLDLQMSWTGLKTLARHLGWLRALWWGLQAQMVRPFAGLGRAQDAKDKGSRKQLGPVLQLYRVLRRNLGQEEALNILGQVVVDATLVFLDSVVGDIDPSSYSSMSEEERHRYLDAFGERFPNADARSEAVSAGGFTHRVTRCRFVEMCSALEVPEIAPLLCAGDLAFFEKGPVDLRRPTTLAQGGPHCEFLFQLRKDDPQ